MTDLIDDLCEILGCIHLHLPDGRIVNKLADITTHGREFLGPEKQISFKNVVSSHLVFQDTLPEWSFLGVLGNGMIGWLRAEVSHDERVYKIRLWVSTQYPTWYPESPVMS